MRAGLCGLLVALCVAHPVAAEALSAQACNERLADAAGHLLVARASTAVLLLAPCQEQPEASLLLGVAGLLSFRLEVVGPALQSAEGSPGLAAEARFLAGVWSALLRDNLAARKNFEDALALDPEHVRSRVGLVVVAAAGGRPGEAARAAAALALKPGPLRSPRRFDLFSMSRSIELALGHATERLGAACPACRRVLADVHAQEALRGDWVRRQERWRLAELQLRGLLEQQPTDLDGVAALGRVLSGRRDHLGALQLYRQALARNPDWAQGQMMEAAVLMDLGREAEAELKLQRRVRLGGGGARAWSLLARARRQQGSTGVRFALARAVAGPKPNPTDLVALGQLLLEAQEHAAARVRFEQALALDESYAGAHYGLAISAGRLGDKKGRRAAMKVYRRLLAQTQAKIVRQEQLRHQERNAAEALKLLSAGQLDAASLRAGEVIEVAPKSPLANLVLGAVELRRGASSSDHLELLVRACVSANNWVTRGGP